MQNFSISTFLSRGWRAAKGEMVVLIGLLLLYTLTTAIISVFTTSAEMLNAILSHEQITTGLHYSGGAVGVILQMLGLLIWVIYSLGFTRIVLKLTDGKSPDFKAFTSILPNVLDYVIASILYTIIIVVGFALLFFPGWIWMMRFGLYSYYIVDENCGAVESLRRSWRATRGHTIDLTLMTWASILVFILGCMVFIVGALVAIPVIQVSWGFVYRNLNPKQEQEAPCVQASPKEPSPITSFMPEGLQDEPIATTTAVESDESKEDPSRFMPQ